MSRRARLISTLVLVCLPLLAAEGLSALYLRLLAKHPRSLAERNQARHLYEPYRGHMLTPNWSLEGYVHDAQGFRRTTEVTQQKAPGTFRVFLMGGSAAYGAPAPPPFPPASLSNDQTIDASLERQLRAALPDRRVEVINAGVTAYWTHQHLVYLLESLLDYDPDLIIFLDGINDRYHTRTDHNQFLSYRYSLPLRVEAINRPTVSEVVRTVFSWLKQYSHAAFLADGALDRLLGWNAAPEDPCEMEIVPPAQLTAEFAAQYVVVSRHSWVRVLRTILLSLRDQGVQAIVATQPEVIFDQSRGRSPQDEQLFAIETHLRPPYYKEKKAFLKPLANRLAAETATELGATFVDLTDVFDDRAQYFIDYCHLSAAGSDRVAERLTPLVVEAVGRAVAKGRTEPG